MRVRVDTDKCCGSGQCVLAAPEVFDQDDQRGFVLLLRENPSDASEPAVAAAIRACPTEAISLIED